MNIEKSEQLLRQAIAEIYRDRGPEFQLEKYKDLRRAYSQSHRHYHTLRHIGEMLEISEQFKLQDRKAFLAAVLYHDFVYNPVPNSPQSNEQKSAVICALTLTEGGVTPTVVARAKALIIMTEKHKAEENDHEALLFMDTDMSIVGADPKRYNQYCVATAREYLSGVPMEKYVAGRKRFLQSLIDQTGPIFRTTSFAGRETQAKKNIAWELANIDHIAARAAALNASAAPRADYRPSQG